MSEKNKTKDRRSSISIMVVVVVVAIIFIGLFALRTNAGGEVAAIEKDAYQAVFLTNGQVYFGKISNIDEQHVSLDSIYYLQTDTTTGQKRSSEDAAKQLEDDSADVKLIKLGNELHGPQDKMVITKSQVLFWENLKDDSKVVGAIKEFSKQTEGDK